jgi:hypothetical protein
MGRSFVFAFVGVLLLGCGGGGSGGAGSAGAGGSGGAGGGGDPSLLYQGPLDDYPVQMALVDDGVAIVTQSYTAHAVLKLEEVPFATGMPGALATLRTDYQPMNAMVSDGESVALVDNAINTMDPSLGDRLSVISTKGGKLVDLITPSDRVSIIQLVGMDHDAVYFLGDGLQSVPRAGGKVKTLTATFASLGAIGGKYAYLVTSGNAPRIVAVPLAGGAEIDVAAAGPFVYALTASPSAAFWVIAPTSDTSNKEVLTGSIGGGAAKKLASGKINLVAADDSGLYALVLTGPQNQANLVHVDPASGKTTTLAETPLIGPVNLAVRPEVADVVMFGSAFVEIAPMEYAGRNQIRRYPK